MRVLLDTCVWGGAQEELRRAGHDAAWTGDWEQDPGDEAILAHAFQNRQVLVTLDKDFGELAIVRGFRHFGIVRLVNLPIALLASACAAALDKYRDELTSGGIVTVERHRVRVRPGSTDKSD